MGYCRRCFVRVEYVVYFWKFTVFRVVLIICVVGMKSFERLVYVEDRVCYRFEGFVDVLKYIEYGILAGIC